MGWFKKKEKKYPIEFDGAYVVKGLGVPAGTPCRIKLTEEAVSIICGEQEFVLKMSNVTNHIFEGRVETETSIQSGSVLQGMIGGAAFGLPGVLAGSLPKSKENRYIIDTLMIKYQGKAGIKIIVLMDHPNSICCAKIEDELRRRVTIVEEEPELKRIEL